MLRPGMLVSPEERIVSQSANSQFEHISLTSMQTSVLCNLGSNGALHGLFSSLGLEHARAHVTKAIVVYGTLERVTLPTENIIAVLGVSLAARYQIVATTYHAVRGDLLVAGAPNKWLRAVLRPEILVVEGSSLAAILAAASQVKPWAPRRLHPI